MDGRNNQSEARHETPSAQSSFVDRPWKLIAFLFLLAGAAGIPAIWSSRGLTATGKIVLTILVSLYTLALLVFFGWFLVWTYHRFVELLA